MRRRIKAQGEGKVMKRIKDVVLRGSGRLFLSILFMVMATAFAWRPWTPLQLQPLTALTPMQTARSFPSHYNQTARYWLEASLQPSEDKIGLLNINCQGFAMKREGSERQ